MADVLALIAAFLFAVAATLQQKGALNLPKISLGDPKSLLRLVGQTWWLFGTLALLAGYAFQAAALDRGRLSIIQPLPRYDGRLRAAARLLPDPAARRAS